MQPRATHRRSLWFSACFTVLITQAGCGGGGSNPFPVVPPTGTAPTPAPAPAPGTGPGPAPAPPPALSAADACAALKTATVPAAEIALPTTGAAVSNAVLVAPSGTGPAAVGEYCQVTGLIGPVDRTAPSIEFNVSLPTNWNSKAMHLFGGGYDGSLVPASSNVPGAAGVPTPLARGYAGFASDGGHKGFEGSFALNDEALENELADHLRKTRDVAVAIMAKRYGAPPTKTYAAGGSGGGRQALYVADRWPSLYDGVISYYPAWSLTAMLTNYTQTARTLAAPGAWSNPAKQQLLASAVVSACDALDGTGDGVVSNVAACTFDPTVLRCAGGTDTGDTCLSDAQIGGFRAYATPLTLSYSLANGTTSYPAYNIFNGGVLAAMGSVPPANPSTTNMAFAMWIGESFVRYYIYRDANNDALQFSPTANGYVQQRLKYLSSRQDINPDMSAFAAKGGKVLIVHGMADQLIPAASSDEFYNRAGTAMGIAKVGSFLKYYQVPGYAHGSGDFNLSVDTLTALEQWVEGGTAPTALVARDANPGNNNRTRPLCEYPTWPKYNGTGDINAASSYTCARS